MLNKLLKEADKIRPGFSSSLGYRATPKKINDLERFSNLPESLKEAYSLIDGTKHQVSTQEMMDFIPGYRFIHRSEIEGNLEMSRELILEGFPFLADYSGNFFCFLRDEIVCVHQSDPTPTRVYTSYEHFIETQIQFYLKRAYFLNSYDFLEMDFEIGDKIGQSMNPDCPYWFE